MPIDLGQFKKKTVQGVKKKPEEKAFKKNFKELLTKKPKKPFLDVLESDEITMDEARAQYIVICKKKPKHDSIQTKNWLINEVMKVLEQSKT